MSNQKFYTNVYCQGNTIYYKEIDGNTRQKFKFQYQPTLYVDASLNPSHIKSLSGNAVESVKFDSIREARDFVSSYSNIGIYGMTSWEYAFISEEYPQDIEFDMSQLNIGNIDIEVESKDGFPEPDEALYPILTVTIKDFNHKNYTVFHYNQNFNEAEWKEQYSDRNWNINFVQCKDEENLLDKLIKYWRKSDFDVITGWNIRMFDIPYLIQRIINLLGLERAKQLSIWNIVKPNSISWMGNDVRVFDIAGLSIIDYMQIYKKFVNDPRESYRLGYISELELGIGKDAYSSTLQELYEKDFYSFIAYNIRDVEIIELLDNKMQLLELTIYMAYKAKVNYIDVLSQVRMWDIKIFNILKKEGIVVPLKETHEKNEAYVGAYVKEPKPGFYKWVVSEDVASLYPSIIKLLNIGIETKNYKVDLSVDDFLKETSAYVSNINYAKESNLTLSVNGVYYTKDQKSFYSRLIESMFDERMGYKKLANTAKNELAHCHDEASKKELVNKVSKYDLKQKAVKIAMNSLYGAIGNEYFRYFDVDNAIAVTMTGQYIIQFIEKHVNVYMNKIMNTTNIDYVVYCDTDSVYINLEPLLSVIVKDKSKFDNTNSIIDLLDKICKQQLQPVIDNICDTVSLDKLNGMDKHIKMVRDVLTDKSVWTSKKHYMMNVWDTEGVRYEKPKLKIMGMEAIKSSTPKACRTKLKDSINYIFTKTEDDLIDLIEEFENLYPTLPIEDIASPRGVNGIEKFSDEKGNPIQGCPYHVRGALAYNKLLKSLNLDKKYPLIKEGEKIKFIALKEPNPAYSKVISFIDTLPKEFDDVEFRKYIDFDAQFNKTFIDPLMIILNAIKWSPKRQASLMEFISYD